MLGYYIRMAARSARRTKMTSAIVVAGLAVGIGTAMTFVTMLYSLEKDPLGPRGDQIYLVQLDSWEMDNPYPGRGSDLLPTQATYKDAVALVESDIPTRASVHYSTSVVVQPKDSQRRATRETARAARADFFAMFDAPFIAGSGWTPEDDRERKQVAVLSKAIANKTFGRTDVVGETISLSHRNFEVVGVLDEWKPSARHYDLNQMAFAETEEVFLPFDTAIALEFRTTGNTDGWASEPEVEGENLSRFERRLLSETIWLQLYVELPDDERKEAYAQYLDDYVLAQREQGRFPRPMQNRLSTVVETMKRWEAVPPVVGVLRTVSLLFLGLCILSVVGLLLGKFLSRSHEIGIRRALGASRIDVFVQHLSEAVLLGIGGGVVGVGLAYGVLAWLEAYTPPRSNMEFNMNLSMLALSLLVAVGSGIAAGLYPAWRVCRTAPAKHLKA